MVGLISTGHAADSIVVAERQTTPSSGSDSLNNDTPSIDQVAASNLAATLASGAELPIATNIANAATSITAKSELAQTSDDLISKPDIIQPNSTASQGITTYVAKAGDTLETVAAQFKLSPNTIKWSNNLDSDALEPGRQLIIPPVDGLVYSAVAGDTVVSIAQKFNTDPQRVVLFNDLELNSAISAGTQIIVPGGSIVATAPTSVQTTPSSVSSRAQTASILSVPATGNGYDLGYCTWYAYNRRAALGIPISGNWGNASSWAILARQSGFLVNTKPSVGAVMQTAAGGDGHVAIVETINSDGSVTVSEMNYVGWDVKSTRTIPASQVSSYNYIH